MLGRSSVLGPSASARALVPCRRPSHHARPRMPSPPITYYLVPPLGPTRPHGPHGPTPSSRTSLPPPLRSSLSSLFVPGVRGKKPALLLNRRDPSAACTARDDPRVRLPRAGARHVGRAERCRAATGVRGGAGGGIGSPSALLAAARGAGRRRKRPGRAAGRPLTGRAREPAEGAAAGAATAERVAARDGRCRHGEGRGPGPGRWRVARWRVARWCVARGRDPGAGRRR